MSEADDKIKACIEQRQSFILDAGAGSGKTYSLRRALGEILALKGGELARNGQSVACITFTNVAKDEIIQGIGETKLVRVSTIHDFLWDMVQPHQRALRSALLKFNAALKATSSRRKDPAELEAILPSLKVTYSDTGGNFLEGRLHHDDLLGVVRIAFADNPLLSKLVAAKHPYIFVDEYQDTSVAVVDVLLRYILPQNAGSVVVGLFGDKLQNIYHGGEHPGVGEIRAELTEGLTPIVKGENRRCSVAVINLLNRIRTDIEQFPAADNAQGDAVYVHLTANDADEALARVRDFLSAERGWTFGQGTERELYLTHRLIARKSGYGGLLETFQNRGGFYRDEFLAGDDARIAFFLRTVEPLASAWSSGEIGRTLSLLRAAGHRLTSNIDKRSTKDALDKLVELRAGGTIEDLLKHVRDSGLATLIDTFESRLAGTVVAPSPDDAEALEREAKDKAFYDALFALPYKEVTAFAAFFNEHTPFATKHGVKGAEFDTVIVVLDDRGANWNIYSFDKYLSGEDAAGNANRFVRTRNVFYVCCSRAKRNLVVVDLGARSAAKDSGVATLFGAEFCIYL